MPLYDFVCHNCDTEFELIVSFSDTKTPDCPNCDASQVERKMGLPAIHFKGSGWYINDSKDSKKGANSGSKKDGDGDSSSSDSGSSTSDANGDGKTSESSDSKKSGKKETSSSKGDSKAKAEKSTKSKKSTKSSS